MGCSPEIDALHQAKGFVARAILPPQTIDDGAVQVQLIEGRINQVVIDGNRYTRDGFIQRRLGLGPGDLVDLNAMAASVSHGPPQFVGSAIRFQSPGWEEKDPGPPRSRTRTLSAIRVRTLTASG